MYNGAWSLFLRSEDMFKVGDLVLVRHHTDAEKANNYILWNKHMSDMEGKTYSVYQVTSDGCVLYDEDGDRWFFYVDSLRRPYDQF